MKVEEEYPDVLQNIEFAIVKEFRRDRSILDMDVLDAVNALSRWYEAEDQGRTPSRAPVSERAQEVYDAARLFCEWRIGRAGPPGIPDPDDDGLPVPISPAEMVMCLKRLRKSIQRWNKAGGKQGYLTFVQQYIV